MSLHLNPNPSSLLRSHKLPHNFFPKSTKPHTLKSFSPTPKPSFAVRSSFNDPTDPPSRPENPPYVDEWGEKTDPEPEPDSKFSGPDPPKDEDECEGGSGVELGNGSPVADGGGVNVDVDGENEGAEKLWELKQALVDTVYGSNLGFRASAEVRAEALELVSQLEAVNPTPAPTETTGLLDGKWILVVYREFASTLKEKLSEKYIMRKSTARSAESISKYTAFSELLPLLAAGTIPSVKVENISQFIDTSSLTIENSTTLSTPVSSFSFSASASFEIRTPSRIQVQFKEGKFNPPEIKSSIDFPESFNIFGQTINLSIVQQSLSPLQNAVEGIGRTVSGQPPLKIPIPGERTQSWLLITYLDEDFRISRGDGGLFVLVKEGSPLLDY